MITSNPPRRIKYYAIEDKALDEINFNSKLKVNEKDALRIVKKLSRHFKLNEPEIYFYGKIDYGFACRNKNKIKLAHEPSLGVLIHELGHIWINQNKLFTGKAHTKKLLRIVKRFAKYIMNKEYWGIE